MFLKIVVIDIVQKEIKEVKHMKKIICTVCMVAAICFCFVACSSEPGDNKNEAVLNSVQDKIILSLTGVEDDSSEIKKVSYKAKNMSDDSFTLEGILVYACDKNLNYIEATDENKSEKLTPGKESHKFEYAYDEKVEFVKVVGYKYTQNGRTFMDTFDNVMVAHRDGSTYLGNIHYTDQQILDRADVKNNQPAAYISDDEVKGILRSVANIAKNKDTTIEKACEAIGMSYDDYKGLLLRESDAKVPLEEIRGILAAVKRLMTYDGLTLSEACKAAGIDFEEYMKLMKNL